MRPTQRSNESGFTPEEAATEESRLRCERVVMALAEAGYPGLKVRLLPAQFDRTMIWCVGPLRGVPYEVRWRAWCVADSPRVACLACFMTEYDDPKTWMKPCLERGMHTTDCGADRSGW